MTTSPASGAKTETCDSRAQCLLSKLAALDARITEAEHELSRLRRQRIPIRIKINEVQDTLLSRLPVEVISHIFMFCTPTMSDACHSEPYQRMRPQPLCLGAVCYAWRMIAWSTPKLWSSISVNMNREDLDTLLPLAEDWLDRSGTLPLTINLYSPNPDQGLHVRGLSTKMMKILNCIIQHSRRWQHLALEMRHELIFWFCKNPTFTLPEDLQSLYIFRSSVYLPHHSLVLRLNAQHSPRAVSLYGLLLRNLDIKCENLTYLYIHDKQSPAMCLNILHCSPKLEHFGFSLDDHNADNFEDVPQHFQHDALRTLQYRVTCPMNLTNAFLRAINFPALEEIDCDSRMNKLPVQSILSIIRGSRVGVWKLSITADYMCGYSAFDMFPETPSITDLTLTISKKYGPLFDDILVALLEGKRTEVDGVDQQSLLPNLKSLTVQGLTTYPWKSVGCILNRRHTSSVSDGDRVKFRPLRSLNIYFDSKYIGPSSDEFVYFIALRREVVALNIFETSVDKYGRVRNHNLISDFEKRQTALLHSPEETVQAQA